MAKQAIYIGSSMHISVAQGQLVLSPREPGRPAAQRNPEELHLLVLDHHQLTLTQAALQALLAQGCAVLVADERHLPQGLLLPLVGHSLQARSQQAQWAQQQRMAPWLWQAIVASKIKNQAATLQLQGHDATQLIGMSDRVLKSDGSNQEAQAARLYFSQLFGPGFSRDQAGSGTNLHLNYAYTLLRSSMARALVQAGLQLCPGLFHRNQYNPFPLADDLMEPYRPMADLLVAEADKDELLNHEELDKTTKRQLLQVLHTDVLIEGKHRQLYAAMHSTAVSLATSYAEKKNLLALPLPCP